MGKSGVIQLLTGSVEMIDKLATLPNQDLRTRSLGSFAWVKRTKFQNLKSFNLSQNIDVDTVSLVTLTFKKTLWQCRKN